MRHRQDPHNARTTARPRSTLLPVDVVSWLLDSDPAIRWQVMRDLTGAPGDAVAAERARVATEGWGARLLALRRDDGLWDTGTSDPEWISLLALALLRDMGLDASSAQARNAIALVRDHVGLGKLARSAAGVAAAEALLQRQGRPEKLVQPEL